MFSCTTDKFERAEKAEKAGKPIKLVLKVGNSQEKVSTRPDVPTTSRQSMNLERVKSKEHVHSSKKKKKKRSASRERKKTRFETGSSVSIVQFLFGSQRTSPIG